ncbi:mitochondrial ribosome-associated GTPase 2 isoform X2 [Periplaneta americana]|uniref:mitochondrial ribosome-associated GTPase 2 isoform X2 n=1 Tax=Periplaneta americana TaxID=6978 RepID=UPI0037E99F6E
MFSLLDPKCITWSVVRRALWQQRLNKSDTTAVALTSKKSKSARKVAQHFVDMRRVRAVGGKGGDGLISFLQLWCNETAGPDGGDGGNGGHVVFQVPVGTIIRSSSGKVVGDLKVEGTMFVAARGGAGGRGNHFFVSPTEQAPKIAEYGADGEELQYVVEVRSMAHVGLIGFPNAGKSTLLQAISRARPKIAPYPFTTLKPHLGMIQYDDYEQVAVADLPGLMPGSHKNRGLGIAFLKHAERCASLLYLLDLSSSEPWTHLETLQYELSQFNSELLERPQVVVANKLDLPEAKKNLPLLKEHVNLPIVAISAKMGTNLEELLHIIKEMYEKYVKKSEDDESDML